MFAPLPGALDKLQSTLRATNSHCFFVLLPANTDMAIIFFVMLLFVKLENLNKNYSERSNLESVRKFLV